MKYPLKIILVVLLFFISSNSYSQFCWYKYSKENCKLFLVTEFTVSKPIGLSDGIHRKFDHSSNIGLMYDLNDKIGVGAHFFLNVFRNGGWHTQHGIRPRISIYPHSDWQVDISPGLILSDSSYPDGFAGYCLETNVNYKDHIGISFRLDKLEPNPFDGKEDVVLSIGIQTDGIKGAILSALGALSIPVRDFINSN